MIYSLGHSVGTVDATNNWWGDATGPHNTRENPYGLGAEVFPSLADANAASPVLLTHINFNPFYNSDAFADLVSSAPITHFNLSFDPNPQTVNATSTLTLTAKDANEYTVVNDTTTKAFLGADSGASFGALLLLQEPITAHQEFLSVGVVEQRISII